MWHLFAKIGKESKSVAANVEVGEMDTHMQTDNLSRYLFASRIGPFAHPLFMKETSLFYPRSPPAAVGRMTRSFRSA